MNRYVSWVNPLRSFAIGTIASTVFAERQCEGVDYRKRGSITLGSKVISDSVSNYTARSTYTQRLASSGALVPAADAKSRSSLMICN